MLFSRHTHDHTEAAPRPPRRWLPLLIGMGVGAVVAGAIGVAYAVVPDASGTFTGCYKTGGTTPGALRVIDPGAGQACLATETRITWQQAGITFRKAYSATTAYARNDVVTAAGTSYIALAPNTGVPVTNTANWAVLAKRGALGPAGPTGPPGPAGPKGFTSGTTMTLAAGDNYKSVTSPFVASANMTCTVTTCAQVSANATTPPGFDGFLRNAVFVNGGAGTNDGQYGLYVVSNGSFGPQPVVSRTSVIAVTSGQSVTFGAYLGSPPSEWVGSTAVLTPSYSCS